MALPPGGLKPNILSRSWIRPALFIAAAAVASVAPREVRISLRRDDFNYLPLKQIYEPGYAKTSGKPGARKQDASSIRHG
jgi:hypothetical protein